MQRPPVLNKRDFSKRYAQGEFGNASPTWHNVYEFNEGAQKNYWTRYHLRNRIAGGATHYNLDWLDIILAWKTIPKPEDWYVSEMAPTHLTLFQGEVMESENGLYLFYSILKRPMRDALREGGTQVVGLNAVGRLKYYLCPNSYEWLQILLDRYPQHVVEFSVYEKQWGTIPGFNTVFWEVRSY